MSFDLAPVCSSVCILRTTQKWTNSDNTRGCCN